MFYLSFIASLIFIAINHERHYNIRTIHFLKYLLLFLDDNVMKKANNFQIAKVQPQSVA